MQSYQHAQPHWDFYPRSPCGERPLGAVTSSAVSRFLSTLSLRRATVLRYSHTYRFFISIHALLAESDHWQRCGTARGTYFYPRSPCGERHRERCTVPADGRFLSTLSLRRATAYRVQLGSIVSISIHALLAESDAAQATNADVASISIHALLAESDHWYHISKNAAIDFYPRSPCGERLHETLHRRRLMPFLSTLSLRRATPIYTRRSTVTEFLSTLSLRRATIVGFFFLVFVQFLSTLSLRRATTYVVMTPGNAKFLSTLSLRRATGGPGG